MSRNSTLQMNVRFARSGIISASPAASASNGFLGGAVPFGGGESYHQSAIVPHKEMLNFPLASSALRAILHGFLGFPEARAGRFSWLQSRIIPMGWPYCHGPRQRAFSSVFLDSPERP